MKLRLAPLALMGAAAGAPQADDAQALLRQGDALPDGALIQSFDEIALSEEGDWLALVSTDQGTFETKDRLLINGAVVLEGGSTLPSGEVVGAILGADLAGDGTPAWIHRLDPGSSPSPEALYIDGVERLRTGTALTGTGFPPGAELRDLQNVRYDGTLALIEGRAIFNATEFDLMFLADFAGGGAPTLQLVLREGQSPAALGGPVTGFQAIFDVAADGTYSIPVNFDDGGTTRRALLTDQGWRAVGGTPGPVPGSTWSHLGNLYSACAAGGLYAYSGHLDTASGADEGVVVGPGGLLAREGQPFGPIPGETVGGFLSRPVGMSAAGEPAWVVPVEINDDVLVGAGAPLLRESTSTISGTGFGAVLAAGLSFRIAVGSGGRELLTVAAGPSGENVLALVEVEVGVPDPACAGVPNSTGAVGVTRGLGSGISAANDLVLESTDLPPQQFGLLVASRTPAFVPGAGGSLGDLCLGGAIGRFNGSVAAADGSGRITTPVDLTAIPQGSGAIAVQPGDTWYFQRWHRDVVGGAAASNLTTSLEITFR